MKIALTDIETSGLDATLHEIIEIGLVLFDSQTLAIEKTLNLRIKPQYPGLVTAEAARVNGYTAKDWEDGMTLKAAMQKYIAATKDCTFMAYNVTFDWMFLQEAADDCEMQLPFHYHKFDLLSMAYMKIPHRIGSYSMKNVCAYLNLEPEPAIHRAINGAQKEYEVFRALKAL